MWRDGANRPTPPRSYENHQTFCSRSLQLFFDLRRRHPSRIWQVSPAATERMGTRLASSSCFALVCIISYLPCNQWYPFLLTTTDSPIPQSNYSCHLTGLFLNLAVGMGRPAFVPFVPFPYAQRCPFLSLESYHLRTT